MRTFQFYQIYMCSRGDIDIFEKQYLYALYEE